MMSPLQIGLLLCGVAVIVGVMVYNRWVTQRALPKRAAVPTTEGSARDASAHDTLLDERTEPVLDGVSPIDGPRADRGAAFAAATPASHGLSDLLDVVVPLSTEAIVSGDAVLAALPGTRRIGSKPFFIEGLNVTTHAWETPVPGQRYSPLQAGIQLANRHGPLNEIEFSEFVVRLQSFADALQLEADFPEMMREVARARELDQFAADHDAQLSFMVRATRAAWSPGYLVQHAAAQGFVAGSIPGRMVLPASRAGDAPVLILQFDTQAALAEDPDHAALREFTLSLDVPQVGRAERPFVRMREAALELARVMEGSVTDDAGHPIGPSTMDQIGADLEQLYDALEARGLPAGSVTARRLFS